MERNTREEKESKSLLLVIDVGNSNMTFGVFAGEKILHQWRIQSNREKTSDEYGIEMEQILRHFGFTRKLFRDVIIASVVPNLMYTLSAMCRRFLKCEPIIVGQGTKTGMPIRYDNPREVGADRIVNAVGGYELYGGPLIIIDIGTAITHDVISEKGEYLGGAIAPGIQIAAEALFLRTAKLPKIELVTPPSAIGKTTVQSMQSGIVLGFIGMIDYVTERILADLHQTAEQTRILGTGGYARLIAKQSRYIQGIDKDITLHGLRIIYERTLHARRIAEEAGYGADDSETV